jgi:hypothetical protein
MTLLLYFLPRNVGNAGTQPAAQSLIQGARNLTINGGVFSLNQQVFHPQDREFAGANRDKILTPT